MCTVNNDIKTLNKLRARGHVLIPVYKYSGDRYYEYDFQNGWNIAKKYSNMINGGIKNITRKEPYREGYSVYESFHFYLKKIKGASIQQTFWIYADEITACQKTLIVTCSRAFIKQLNKGFVDHY